MAVWQARIDVALGSPHPGGWAALPGFPRLRRDLSALLGPEHPLDWTEGALHWGEFDRHDAQLWREDDEAATFFVHFDLREDWRPA